MSQAVVGSKACKPNPSLEPLAFLIGEWATTGTHPAAPRDSLPGLTTFAWAEGGAFLVMRSQTDHPDFPDGLAIFGSDNVLGAVTMCWFDQRGISRICPVTFGDGWVSWHHDDPAFMQRVTITAHPDGQGMTSRGEMSKDAASWTADLSQVFTRFDADA